MYQDNSSFISDNIDILMQNSKNILRKLDKIGDLIYLLIIC